MDGREPWTVAPHLNSEWAAAGSYTCARHDQSETIPTLEGKERNLPSQGLALWISLKPPAQPIAADLRVAFRNLSEHPVHLLALPCPWIRKIKQDLNVGDCPGGVSTQLRPYSVSFLPHAFNTEDLRQAFRYERCCLRGHNCVRRRGGDRRGARPLQKSPSEPLVSLLDQRREEGCRFLDLALVEEAPNLLELESMLGGHPVMKRRPDPAFAISAPFLERPELLRGRSGLENPVGGKVNLPEVPGLIEVDRLLSKPTSRNPSGSRKLLVLEVASEDVVLVEASFFDIQPLCHGDDKSAVPLRKLGDSSGREDDASPSDAGPHHGSWQQPPASTPGIPGPERRPQAPPQTHLVGRAPKNRRVTKERCTEQIGLDVGYVRGRPRWLASRARDSRRGNHPREYLLPQVPMHIAQPLLQLENAPGSSRVNGSIRATSTGEIARKARMMEVLLARERRSTFIGTMSDSPNPASASRETRLSAPQVSRKPPEAS